MLTSIGKLVADGNSEGLHASAGLNLTDLCAAVLGGWTVLSCCLILLTLHSSHSLSI